MYMHPKSLPPKFMNMDALLDCFSGTKTERKKKYAEFVRG
ncbi:hypothetical protein BRO54_3812 [Geobacillus proteiniphilus]|uniref:Uncharacterized protein n=1 Tax=Geobacillus proteiniphilus TaxID=860353 RepID=A0A1Q5SID7_9BACL|nr:hypothetical protein BRO54_3812 [Geobacillus proteiniphilus]